MQKVYKLSLAENMLVLEAKQHLAISGSFSRAASKQEQKEIKHRLKRLDFERSGADPLDGGPFYIIRYSKGKEELEKTLTKPIPKLDMAFINFIEGRLIEGADWKPKN